MADALDKAVKDIKRIQPESPRQQRHVRVPLADASFDLAQRLDRAQGGGRPPDRRLLPVSSGALAAGAIIRKMSRCTKN